MMNNTTLPEQPMAPQYIVITATIFYALIFLTGVLGNVLVIIIIKYSRTLKTSVNMYLLNLCVADLLVLLVCMPTALAEIYTKEVWYFGGAMCKLVPFLENSVANASVLTIIAIGVERYRVVSNPLSVIDDEMGGRIWKVILSIWIISLVASAPCLGIAVYRNSTLVDMTPIMVCRNTINMPWKSLYLIALNVMFFLVPSGILFGLYGHLCRLLLRTSQLNHKGPVAGRMNYKDRQRIQRQVLNIIGSIVIIFFICHLPLRVTGLYFILENADRIQELGLETYLNILFSTRIMFYLNHALNPIIYNCVSSKFRSAVRSLCSKRSNSCSFASTERRRKQSYNFTSNKRTVLTSSKYKRTENVELDQLDEDRNGRRQSRSGPLDSNKKHNISIYLDNTKVGNVKGQISSSGSDSVSKGSSGDRGGDLQYSRSNRQKMNDFYNDYGDRKARGSQEDPSSNTTSSKDYDLKINVNQKAVCITLNMKKVGEMVDTA